jgi:hypothetical protein
MLSRKQRAFLSAYVQEGTLSGAERAANVSRRSHYFWLEQVEYTAAFQKAQQELTDRLIAEAERRAIEEVRKR